MVADGVWSWSWRFVLVISVLYVPAIVVKLRNPEMWGHLFSSWGYPFWGAVVVSWIELVGLAALWIPALAPVASAVLTVFLVGATGTWLIHGPRIAAAYPGTILVLVAFLVWSQQARMRRDSQAGHPQRLST